METKFALVLVDNSSGSVDVSSRSSHQDEIIILEKKTLEQWSDCLGYVHVVQKHSFYWSFPKSAKSIRVG